MDLSIIIVSWNVRNLLKKCLQSILRDKSSLSIEVIVVDNASQDRSAEMVKQDFPQVRLIPMDDNVGFAKANNEALRTVSGKYVFILNPDTEVQPNALKTLFDYMEQHAECSLVAPRIINPDGSYQVGAIRSDPTFFSQAMILLKLHHLFPRSLGDYYQTSFDSNREQSVKQIMGAAMFFRYSALRKVGFFDEQFFLWFEEVDLCSRLREAGERIMYVPSASIIHHGGQSFGQKLPLAKQRIYNASVVHYFMKRRNFISASVLWILSLISLCIVLVYQLVTRHGSSAS